MITMYSANFWDSDQQGKTFFSSFKKPYNSIWTFLME